MEHQGPSRISGPRISSRTRRVLVVQEKYDEAIKTAHCIQEYGHLVACASAAFDGIRLMMDDPYDFIVAEWPHGRELLLYLNRNATAQRPSIVVLTSPPTIEQVIDAYHRGVDIVLSKPVSAETWGKFLELL